MTYADRIPLTRPVPTTRHRLDDARTCGHTPDQHRHTDGQAADLRDANRAVIELTAERDEARRTLVSVKQQRDRLDRLWRRYVSGAADVERALIRAGFERPTFRAAELIDQLAAERDEARQLADFRAGVIERHRQELGAAGHVVNFLRSMVEGADRVLATYDTTPEPEAEREDAPHEDPARLRGQLAEAHADCARYATERDEARAELAAAQELIAAAKTWRRWHGNTNAAYADACQALEAAVDALPPSLGSPSDRAQDDDCWLGLDEAMGPVLAQALDEMVERAEKTQGSR